MRLAFVVGTRPDAIKMAPLILRAAERYGRDALELIATWQHQDMLKQVLDVFGLVPDVDLPLREEGTNVTNVLAAAVSGIATELMPRARAIVVQGDTATTLAGALAGFTHGIPVVHLEAGL